MTQMLNTYLKAFVLHAHILTHLLVHAWIFPYKILGHRIEVNPYFFTSLIFLDGSTWCLKKPKLNISFHH